MLHLGRVEIFNAPRALSRACLSIATCYLQGLNQFSLTRVSTTIFSSVLMMCVSLRGHYDADLTHCGLAGGSGAAADRRGGPQSFLARPCCLTFPPSLSSVSTT